MSANKTSSIMLLGLFWAVACLLGVFAIMDASTANASLGEVSPPSTDSQPGIIISPTELQAELHPDELITQTLWITNTGDSELSFTIYEMTASVKLSGMILEPAAVPIADPDLQAQVAARGSSLAIIYLREQPDVSTSRLIPDKDSRAQFVYDRLLEIASHSQAMYQWLKSQGTQPQRLLIANAIAATLNSAQLKSLTLNPQVRQISPNHLYMIIPTLPTRVIGPQLPAIPALQPGTVEWNIAKIRADEAWSTFDVTGEGAVVGIVDTGVLYDHTALVNSYRGNLGGGNFDHNYNWYDFVNHQPVPYDDMGHGTMITGIVSGDDGGANQIGVAPGADWIAVKACSVGGVCSDIDLINALQWMMAPTDLNNENPDPSKAPDVVFGGWGTTGCNSFFMPYMLMLRSAGILPIFSTGGGGPTCESMGSPADLPDVLATGATDVSDIIASFSPRGPSCYGEIKPDVVAPGVNIRSSFNDYGYQVWSGTAESAAHTAGTAALVISADPLLGPDGVEDILYSTTLCSDNQQCSPGAVCPDPNNTYGHGRIDAYEAVSAALGNPPNVNLPWLSETPISATLQAGEGIPIAVTFNSTGLGPGSFTGALGISSDDPIQPFVTVPVTLEVTSQNAPIIVIDPLSLSATLPVDGVQTETLTISNIGGDVLTYNLHEVTGTRQMLAAPVDITIPQSFPVGTPMHVDADVQSQLLFMNQTRLIIYLRGFPDISTVSQIHDRADRVQFVYNQLLDLSAQSDDLFSWLQSQGAQPRRLLTANAIAATLNAVQLKSVIGYPQVRRVGTNGHAEIQLNDPATLNWLTSSENGPDTVEWNIAKIRADQVWSTFGIRGQGAVIGVVDTGVMYTHPALIAQYRGNLGSGNYENNYNWYDLINGQVAPYDDHGHGTFGTGIAVGDDGLGNQIGVAPSAKWIAVKAMDGGGGATEEDLHAALEWMLAPTDLNGLNPDPTKAPNVVLNMWGLWGGCIPDFITDLSLLRAANILPVFAPGGEGPACGLVRSPADNPDAISAGATDINDEISGFSARGPSCFDGSIKPDLAAPGVNVRSSTIDNSYQIWSGTSFSTAHLAGAASLLFSADPQLSIDQLEQSLFDTAICYDANVPCAGDSACPGANNTYGHGRIDIYEAVAAVFSQPFDLPWLDETPTSGSLNPDESVTITVTFNAGGMLPGEYTGGIAFQSNDPLNPFSTLPVTMTVTSACQGITDLNASFTPPDPVVGEVITFTGIASGSLPISFSWDFLDGVPLVGPVVTHVFDIPGAYFVGLTAENACDLKTVDLAVPVGAIMHRSLLPLVGK